MSDWFRSMFEPAKPPDCDECQSEPDWYRMGLTPPAKRARNLSKVNPHRFLDRIVELRDGYGDDEADASSGETVEQFMRKPPAKHTQSRKDHMSLASMFDIRNATFSIGFDPAAGEDDQ